MKGLLVVMGVLMAARLIAGSVSADAVGGDRPTFTKGKFVVPVSRDDVERDWTARGYFGPSVKSYPQGWSRGEHTHPESLIMTVITGRMEFLFAGQRFVVEPGDELLYPAHTVHSAKNLYDGATQMMSSTR